MSVAAVSLKKKTRSVPGKVFVLGEYAVLADHPALIATVGPRFRTDFGKDSGATPGAPDFHPRSPAGRLLSQARAARVSLPSFGFVDPYRGAGGFGASTAQFALLYRALAQEMGLELS